MRLIDADAMYDEFVRKPSIYDTTDLPYMLGDMPTIDAIPMWWITEKYLDVLNKNKELSKAVWLVRKAWIEEQEAQK